MDDFRKFLFWSIIVNFSWNIASIVLPLRLSDLGITYTQMGLIFAIGPILALFVSYISGAHSDVVGRKKYLAFASFLLMLYSVLLVFSLSIWHFVLASLLGFAYLAIDMSCSNAYLSDTVPKTRRGYFVGIFNGITGIFSFITISIASFLLIYLGYANVFILCSVVGLIAIFVSMSLKETVRTEKAKKNHSNVLDFKGISKKVWVLFAISFISQIAFQSITAFGFPLYFKSLGADIGLIGLLVGITWLGNYLAQLFFGKFVDSVDPAKLYAAIFLLALPINLCLIFISNPFVAVAVLVVSSGLFGVLNLAFIRLMFGSAGKSNGRDLAFISNSYFLGLIFGSFVGGLIMDHLGFSWIFILRAILFFICGVLTILSYKLFKK